ncbi:molecule interacting with CasL isoform X1 [Rhynchophorus ferrugineus]|uniref:molecule interacting with CasL isoform X1 n=1 Tax=Rhynchophorus ferrugineus TaxID=354439 RepID=UPI003FCDC51F
MDRHSGAGPPQHMRGRPVSGKDVANANEYFEPFLNATTMKNILGYHRSMCEFLHLKPNVFPHFYPKLKSNLNSWRAKAVWKKFDLRASHKCYNKGKACAGTKVLVIGAGPCGLRTAIEAQLLGAKVVIVEKRDRLSRNNVLHLWPFVIEDLRMLGAKKFFGKFCAGAIDHISIRQLQCILLKVALLLGVEVHTEVSFVNLVEPSADQKTGWRAEVKPEDHPVAQYEFDVIIGADGKRNTLQGFKRKEFRGKLAIAITANFINKKTEAEARVEEISGVAFIFNQKFFKDLQDATRIDLENIVYYKDDTHYFVMTAKKASLLEKEVIKQDLADTEKLLAPDNVNRDKLYEYAREAAEFSTNYQMTDLEFAVNHYGQPDVAMFDFTSMYAAEYASKVVERNGSRLLMILVGDSLLEPFWPTGSGCARGFLSSLDAAWAIRSWSSGQYTPLDVLAERESIYRLLAQTTPDNLNKDWKAYTLDPSTRYPNLNKTVVVPHQTECLYDTDNKESVEKMKRASLNANIKHEHVSKKRRRGGVDNEVLLSWLTEQLRDHEDVIVTDIASVFQGGRALCAIIHHYRPDLLDYNAVKDNEPGKCNQLAMDILEKDLAIPPFMTGEEITSTQDNLAMTTYLTQVYYTFRGEIPHIKHPKLRNKSSSVPKISKITINKSLAKICKHSSHINLEVIDAKGRRKKLKRTTFKSESDSENVLDLTYPDDKCLETKLKFSKSKTMIMIANLQQKKKKKAKIKKSNLSIIPENEEKVNNLSKRERNCIDSTLLSRNLQCETFFQASFTSSIPNDVCGDESSDTKNNQRKKTKMRTIKSTLGLKYFNPLQVIREHLKMKKNQLKSILSKPVCQSTKELDNIPEKAAPVCPVKNKSSIEHFKKSNGSIRIQLLERSSRHKIRLQNVEFKSSMNLVKISSKACASKRFETTHHILDDKESLHVEQIFMNNDVLSTYSSKMDSARHVEKITAPQEKLPVSLTPTDLKIINALGAKRTAMSVLKEKCHRSGNKLKIPVGKKLTCDIEKNAMSMDPYDDNDSISPQTLSRVRSWISQNDFREDQPKIDPEYDMELTCDVITDMTSVTQAQARAKGDYDDVRVETRTDVIKCISPMNSVENFTQRVRNHKENKPMGRSATKFTQHNSRPASLPPASFPVIVEARESGELPEATKHSSFSIKSIKVAHQQQSTNNLPVSRPSSRHKRHADMSMQKAGSMERKQRKRRTLDRFVPSVEDRQKVLEEIAANRLDRHNKRKQHRQRQTEQFIKSMQMLQANAKPDKSEPFEDYSIFLYRQTAPKFEDRVKDLEKQFTYVPDYETKSGLKPLTNTNADEDIASKIKSLEDKWSNPQPAEKKPKDLLRAIGKIETSDWNIKQIEKKILENKLGKPSSVIDKERVPRWSKEEFKARQTKMENKHLDRQDSSEAKFADIDKNIKQLDLKLKEGNIRELGQNKVASITEKLVSKTPQEQIKTAEKPAQPKTVNLPSGSEFCHFCDKKVYLMERLSAEGRFFHNGCFKCQYCHTQLRLGSYMFDKDGQYGHRFFCSQHYGMPGELPKPTKITRKASLRGSRDVSRSPSKRLPGVAGVDLLDRVQTPERIEFSNLSAENISSDQEEPLSQMDEDEWTDKNFGASCNELDESDDDSSSSFSSDSDDEDVFDDALEQPATKEGTLKLAERWKKCYRKGMHSDSDGYSSSDHSSYYENSSDDSDSETATEGEEEIRARELRKQEVRVEPPVVQTDTGTDTEMVSDESSSETSSEIQNSATEISTDSEFAHDEPTPTRELPAIALNDVHVTKTRGSGAVVDPPRRIQVTSGFLQGPVGTAPHHAQFLLKPAPYALNRTQSTGGIATKVSLELKRRYLLGEGEANSIQKSGSASALDSKFKSFQSTISDCQRMLKPAVEPSASMQLFCSKLDERLSPSGPPPSLPPPDITITTITEQSSLSGDGAKQPNNSNERIDTVPMGDEQEQSTESSSSSEEAATTPNFRFESIPRVEVHAAKDSDAEEMALDSLCGPSPAPDQIKSVGSEKKELNQPKPLPNLEHILPDIHKVLHVRIKSDKEESPEDNKSIKTVSGKSSPDGTAALTETELSDWARDENVSDSIELDISQGSDKKKLINLAKLSEFEEAVNEYICPKDTTDANKKSILANDNDLDSIEYMDTGTETSSEDGIGNSQDGYVLFKNEDDLVDDSLNPQVNEILEARNIYLISTEKEQQHHQADLKKSSDLDSNVEAQNKQKPTTTEHEEDSLVVVDTGTTTEENTCSDSTVKNITEITKDMKEEKSRPSLKIEQFQKQRLEDKLAKVKAEQALIKDQMQQSNQKENIEHNIQFEEHCQRLQSKVEFGNAKDSIDIRKSRRKSKSDSPHKPDLIREEKERPSPPKDITLNLNPVIRPDILYKKENIKKERDVNQKLIQEMVMNKMKAENKSLERRRRSRGNLGSLSPCRPYPIQKSSTTDVVSQTNLSNVSKNDSIASSTYATPDLLSNSMALKHSQSTDTVPGINSSNENYETPMASTPPKQNISKPLSVFSETRRKNETPLTTTDNYSMPDIRKQLFLDEFKTPKAPPRYNRPSIIRTAEKMKEDARARVRLLSNEDLGLSPEDKLNKLRERVGKKSNRASDDLDIHVQESIESLVLNTERRNSLLYPNDTLTKKRNNSFRRSMSGDSAMPTKDLSVSECRPKSISGIPKNLSLSKSNNIETDTKKACKSDPNLLDTHGTKKKSKDRERRKSITKLIAGIFAKKTPSANSTTTKGLFAKLSPKSKTTSKSLSYLDLCKHETPIEESTRRKSLSENNIQKRDPSPPPIPPLPVNYSVKATDESSDGDNVDCKHAEQGSCDTLDQSVNLETSISSMTSSRRSLKARKISRQAQLKRHRMAQEIQRKLEETEVKTRELEQRGVHVEKSLRGENGSTSKDESELLQEWFDLMRDKTELRRYEKELMVRAKELELEDRHARLQAELRERLENNDNKTEDDVKLEKNIIKEMMDIVSERDSLITVLEEDRQRYTNEDKDLEEQMLAKGLRLTPIQKSTEK